MVSHHWEVQVVVRGWLYVVVDRCLAFRNFGSFGDKSLLGQATDSNVFLKLFDLAPLNKEE